SRPEGIRAIRENARIPNHPAHVIQLNHKTYAIDGDRLVEIPLSFERASASHVQYVQVNDTGIRDDDDILLISSTKKKAEFGKPGVTYAIRTGDGKAEKLSDTFWDLKGKHFVSHISDRGTVLLPDQSVLDMATLTREKNPDAPIGSLIADLRSRKV